MILLMVFSFISVIISLALMVLCMSFYKKSILDREKMSSFECGFDPFSSARSPFSLRFFLLALIFLIFDVEISLLLPILITKNFSHLISWFMVFLVFIFILLWGLYHEWFMNSLDWTK